MHTLLITGDRTTHWVTATLTGLWESAQSGQRWAWTWEGKPCD